MKNIVLLYFLLFSLGLCAQQSLTHSIEHGFRQVDVFNPEWETQQTLNPCKYEHMTGYFREELARIILSAVSEKKVKIYDIRRREISLDSVIRKIIDFEKNNFGISLGRDSVFSYIIPYVSSYQFEEFIDYNYNDLSLSKKVKAYCPYLVRYRSFDQTKADSVQLPLFWIFPSEQGDSSDVLHIPDTVLSVQKLVYPNQMPFSSSLFYQVQNGKIKVFRSNGLEFETNREIEQLFILSSNVSYYDEHTEEEKTKTVFSDIVPEDIVALRLGELWSIDRQSMEIKKEVCFFLPLYFHDDDMYSQLGFRIYNKAYRNK